MSRLVPLLVALLAIAAGCTGGPIAPGATDAPPTETGTPTVTDTPTATDEPTSTPTPGADPSDLNGTLAPGVSADGIENASALLAAHADELGDRGFRLVADRQFAVDGETFGIEQRVAAAPHADRVRSNATNKLAGNVTAYRTWLNESMARMLVRVDADGETRYRIPPVGPAGSEGRAHYARQFAQVRQLSELLRGGEFEVTAVNETDDGRLYTLVGTNFTVDGTYGDREVRVDVTEEGVIRAFESTGSLSEGGSFSYGYHVARLGVDSVDRPDWVADAPAPIDTRPTTGFENCSTPYLTLSNEGSDAVPAGSVVTLTLNGTEHEATLDAALETGERRALYLDASGDLRMGDADSVPANRTAMPNEVQMVVETGDGLLLVNGAMGFGCESASEGGSGSGSESGSSGGGSSGSGSAGDGSAGG